MDLTDPAQCAGRQRGLAQDLAQRLKLHLVADAVPCRAPLPGDRGGVDPRGRISFFERLDLAFNARA